MSKMMWTGAAALAAMIAAGAAQAQGKTVGPKAATKIVCWTDEKGQRMCGDRVPPEYSKKERQVYNQRGIQVEAVAREKTPEELEAERKAKEDAEEQARLEQEQLQYDKFLVQTYRTVKDLEATREDRVTTLDSRIKLGEKISVDTEAQLKALREQEAAARKGGKEPPAKLKEQIKEYERSLAQNEKANVTLRQEREKTIAKFDADIARYKLIKSRPSN